MLSLTLKCTLKLFIPFFLSVCSALVQSIFLLHLDSGRGLSLPPSLQALLLPGPPVGCQRAL